MDSESVQENFLCSVGFGDTAEYRRSRLAVFRDCRKNNVTTFDSRELFQQSPGSITETGSVHPLRQRFPQNIRQEADQNVSTDSLFLLVPDRTDPQFVLGDPKGPFCLGELNVSLPQGGRRDVIQIGPQQIAAFRK